uniref:Predicted protein n=1 Tax=Hordeum vulgare subsp. vulgare TaxID=112509 RepID=F2E9Q9_HORVV|nr:predicted protein [Hordeum vulgare subsp. vulgare]
MAFSSMVTMSTLVPLGTSSCSVRSRSLIFSRRFCNTERHVQILGNPHGNAMNSSSRNKCSFDRYRIYLCGEALRVALGRGGGGHRWLRLARLPARTARPLGGPRLRVPHARRVRSLRGTARRCRVIARAVGRAWEQEPERPPRAAGALRQAEATRGRVEPYGRRRRRVLMALIYFHVVNPRVAVGLLLLDSVAPRGAVKREHGSPRARPGRAVPHVGACGAGWLWLVVAPEERRHVQAAEQRVVASVAERVERGRLGVEAAVVHHRLPH